jgi:hypothetical protein
MFLVDGGRWMVDGANLRSDRKLPIFQPNVYVMFLQPAKNGAGLIIVAA